MKKISYEKPMLENLDAEEFYLNLMENYGIKDSCYS
jgi:hypothetical protein